MIKLYWIYVFVESKFASKFVLLLRSDVSVCSSLMHLQLNCCCRCARYNNPIILSPFIIEDFYTALFKTVDIKCSLLKPRNGGLMANRREQFCE